MKKLNLKALASAAMAVTLLASVAAAAPLPNAAPDATAPSYELRERTMAPVLVWGKAVELGEKSISLENDNESDPYNKITVNVNEDTMVLDAVTGESKTFADLKKGESVYAYVSPAMTRSMPPIANGILVLCNIPADYMVPTFAEVQSATTGEDGAVSALTDRDVILHMNQDTELVPYLTKEVVTLADIQPGTRVLAWYSIVALSMPAQATPTKVMVFPYSYESYVEDSETSITIEGDMVVEAKAVDGKLLAPVRKVAEALGCTINWAPDTNTVAVLQNDGVKYEFVIGGENVTLGGGEGEMTLTVPASAVDGVTWVAVDDLLVLHNLKLVQGIGA